MEQTELEKMVLEMKDKLDNILNTVSESEKKYQHDVGVKGFTERNGESLGKYVDKLKKLNGDDFDLYSSAYDEYNDSFSDIEESTYVAQLVSEIENKISKLREALGEDEVEIESDDEKTEKLKQTLALMLLLIKQKKKKSQKMKKKILTK